MSDPSAGMPESGWIIAALLSLAGLVGGFIAWLIGRKDRSEDRQAQAGSTREAKLEAWHRELSAREAHLNTQQAAFQAMLERRLAEQDDKISGLEGELEKYRVSTAALFARVAHHDPEDPVLKQVGQLLGSGIPIMPGDFDGALDDLIKRLS